MPSIVKVNAAGPSPWISGRLPRVPAAFRPANVQTSRLPNGRVWMISVVAFWEMDVETTSTTGEGATTVTS